MTEPLPSALDPWPDTVRWRPVSSRLIWVEELQLLLSTGTLILGCVIAWQLLDWRFIGIVAGLLAAVGLVRAAAIVRMVRAWGYAERERDLLVRHGRIVRHLSIVPYARMQFVDVSAGPLERAFNLATVQLHTAAAATDARVPGLDPTEAARLRDRLAALGEDRSEGL